MSSKRTMTATEALAMLRRLDDEESDGGAGSDQDSDVSWSLDSSFSSESDSDHEFIPIRKKSQLDISDPGTELVPSDTIPAIVQNPDPSDVPAVPRQHSPPRDEEAGLINPLTAERRETAKDGTVW
ncbi:hypothetical protein R3I93_006639 [Phoxinus phoxinus]|uniref:Uncharacterized protein n=1 Tax=Phoxinus phoxinus TaxID=58324 RepID=A0AAN9H8Z9_9TELE